MQSRRKTDNPTQPFFDQFYDDQQEEAKKELKEVDQENNEQLKRVLKYVGGLFTASLVMDGKLKPNSTQKRMIKAQFLDLITNVGLKVGEKESKVLTNTLKEAAKEANYGVQYIIQAGFRRDISYIPLSDDAIEDIITRRVGSMTYSDRIWRNQANMVAKFEKELRDTIIQGKSYQKFAKELREGFAYKTYEAYMTARTEIGAIQSNISDKVFKESGVVTGVQWVSELRSNTNAYDASLHGKTWAINEDHPVPVRDTHPNCVCVIIPIVPGWKASKDFMGEYSTWKKTTQKK